MIWTIAIRPENLNRRKSLPEGQLVDEPRTFQLRAYLENLLAPSLLSLRSKPCESWIRLIYRRFRRLAGSVIGGLTTGFTTRLTQRSQARAGMIAHDVARREDLVTPNGTMADIRELAKTGGGVDPLKDFAEARREDQSALAIR